MPLSLTELVEPNQTLLWLNVDTKADVLREVAVDASRRCGVEPGTVIRLLTAREQLGSTGVGHGIALPHSSVPGIDRFVTVFARLRKPIDFRSADDRPVDIVCALLTPDGTSSGQHLAALAALSRALRDRVLLDRLRCASGGSALAPLLGITGLPEGLGLDR